LDGIVIGAVGGAFAGLAVWLAQLGKKCAVTWWDKRKIYK